jgi:hypothetical protein
MTQKVKDWDYSVIARASEQPPVEDSGDDGNWQRVSRR